MKTPITIFARNHTSRFCGPTTANRLERCGASALKLLMRHTTRFAVLALTLFACTLGVAVEEPSPSRPFSFNWMGFYPASVAPSFPNGNPPTCYVDITRGSDSAMGSAPGLSRSVPAGSAPGANAFQHIWKAVNATTNTLIVVAKGNYSEVITNINGHIFYFMPGATNMLSPIPAGIPSMFYTPPGGSNLNLYVGGFGSFITVGPGEGAIISGAVSTRHPFPQIVSFRPHM